MVYYLYKRGGDNMIHVLRWAAILFGGYYFFRLAQAELRKCFYRKRNNREFDWAAFSPLILLLQKSNPFRRAETFPFSRKGKTWTIYSKTFLFL